VVNGRPRSAARAAESRSSPFLHRVDLCREHDAAQQARGIGIRLVHDRLGALEARPATRLVPGPGDGLRRAHAPARAGVAGPNPDTQAGLAHDVHPTLERRGEIDYRRDTRAHEFRVGEPHRRLLAGRVEPEGLEPLEQPAHVLFRHAVVLAHAAIGGLRGQVRVHVDEARHRQHAPTVDHGYVRIDRAVRVRCDCGNAPVAQQDVDITAVHMLLRGPMPQDGPGSVVDQRRCRHRGSPGWAGGRFTPRRHGATLDPALQWNARLPGKETA
jgi:hypothetical protein